jgi:hypothetical protein
MHCMILKKTSLIKLEFFVSNCLMIHYSIALMMTCKCRQRYSANMFVFAILAMLTPEDVHSMKHKAAQSKLFQCRKLR